MSRCRLWILLLLFWVASAEPHHAEPQQEVQTGGHKPNPHQISDKPEVHEKSEHHEKSEQKHEEPRKEDDAEGAEEGGDEEEEEETCSVSGLWFDLPPIDRVGVAIVGGIILAAAIVLFCIMSCIKRSRRAWRCTASFFFSAGVVLSTALTLLDVATDMGSILLFLAYGYPVFASCAMFFTMATPLLGWGVMAYVAPHKVSRKDLPIYFFNIHLLTSSWNSLKTGRHQFDLFFAIVVEASFEGVFQSLTQIYAFVLSAHEFDRPFPLGLPIAGKDYLRFSIYISLLTVTSVFALSLDLYGRGKVVLEVGDKVGALPLVRRRQDEAKVEEGVVKQAMDIGPIVEFPDGRVEWVPKERLERAASAHQPPVMKSSGWRLVLARLVFRSIEVMHSILSIAFCSAFLRSAEASSHSSGNPTIPLVLASSACFTFLVLTWTSDTGLGERLFGTTTSMILNPPLFFSRFNHRARLMLATFQVFRSLVFAGVVSFILPWDELLCRFVEVKVMTWTLFITFALLCIALPLRWARHLAFQKRSGYKRLGEGEKPEDDGNADALHAAILSNDDGLVHILARVQSMHGSLRLAIKSDAKACVVRELVNAGAEVEPHDSEADAECFNRLLGNPEMELIVNEIDGFDVEFCHRHSARMTETIKVRDTFKPLSEERLEALSSILQCQRLDLSGIDNLSDKLLGRFARTCVDYLVEINLQQCPLVTEVGVKYILTRCKNVMAITSDIKKLHLSDTDLVKDSDDRSVMMLARGQQQLEELYIGQCQQVSDDGVKEIAKNCPRLRAISLAYCVKVSDESIVKLARSCPSLTGVNLRGCHKITDDSLLSLAENCKKLSEIDLYICNTITDVGVMKIAESCSGLTKMNLTFCMKITNKSVEALVSNCPGMTDLALHGCKNITDVAINEARMKIGVYRLYY
mmetsp:Transcript_43665/g.100760  ORF Transcript_43665/g.100760 Transcript_43665/m.100760 type:complete len:920 (+) Transcript_43665:74-2833(+)